MTLFRRTLIINQALADTFLHKKKHSLPFFKNVIKLIEWKGARWLRDWSGVAEDLQSAVNMWRAVLDFIEIHKSKGRLKS